MSDRQQTPPSRLLIYLRLFRLPNVFTAIADVTMGFLFVRGSLDPLSVYLCLVVASSLLYTAGMVLNDVCDFAQDLDERPHRPIPSGQIPVKWATWLGCEMLFVGVGLAWLSGYLITGNDAVAIGWRGGAVATILVACIVLYDAWLKKTPLGPIGMGACRFFNVLLAMSVATWVDENAMWRLGYDESQLMVAGGIGVYIVGVTWFARNEAKDSSSLQLGLAVMVMIGGMTMLGYYPEFSAKPIRLQPEHWWPMLLLLLGFTIVRRCFVAVMDPRPEFVQAAVRQCILSLIVLDAAICLTVAPAFWAVGVLALLVPTLLLGKWVYST